LPILYKLGVCANKLVFLKSAKIVQTLSYIVEGKVRKNPDDFKNQSVDYWNKFNLW